MVVLPLRRVAVVLALLVTGLAPLAPAAAQEAPEGGSSTWRTVSAGGEHTCGIRTDGRLFCWGDDSAGQLGDGGTNTDQSTPVEVAGGVTTWTSVAAGGYHTCARRSTGRLYCWGDDDTGQLGDGGGGADQPAPVQVAGGHTTWTSVAAGGSHTCARRSTGRLFCWGWDFFGQLGDGATIPVRFAPREVAGGHTTWTAITAGTAHTCALRSTGRLFCWGSDSNGRLGNGGADVQAGAPVQVAGGHTSWTAAAAGAGHTCARRTSGRLWCWGWDVYGQVGNSPPLADASTPVLLAGGATTWGVPDTDLHHTCARRTTGRLFCWGHDGNGRLGDGGGDTDRAAPVEVDGGLTTWTAVDAGNDHTCARRSDRTLWCWGNDGSGRLGDGGAETDSGVPVPVDG